MTTNDLLARASQRKAEAALPYAGAITPAEALEWLRADTTVKLVDVRTQAERDWVGRVDIPDAQHFSVQWSLYPGGAKNPEFLQQLAGCASQDNVILFLCRSGVRSKFAAQVATEAGYRHCYDILEGFEGDRDGDGHRKTIGGWCRAGLPWVGA